MTGRSPGGRGRGAVPAGVAKWIRNLRRRISPPPGKSLRTSTSLINNPYHYHLIPLLPLSLLPSPHLSTFSPLNRSFSSPSLMFPNQHPYSALTLTYIPHPFPFLPSSSPPPFTLTHPSPLFPTLCYLLLFTFPLVNAISPLSRISPSTSPLLHLPLPSSSLTFYSPPLSLSYQPLLYSSPPPLLHPPTPPLGYPLLPLSCRIYPLLTPTYLPRPPPPPPPPPHELTPLFSPFPPTSSLSSRSH